MSINKNGETEVKEAIKWDVFEYFGKEVNIAAYLTAALEDSNISVIVALLSDVVRTKG